MAGISLAKKLISERRNKGKVIALGKTIYGERFMLIQLEDDRGRIHQLDYGSDIRFAQVINLNDIVELEMKDEYTAMWEVKVRGGPLVTQDE